MQAEFYYSTNFTVMRLSNGQPIAYNTSFVDLIASYIAAGECVRQLILMFNNAVTVAMHKEY